MALEEKLSELGYKLPSPPQAAGLYKPVLINDGVASFSGHLPIGIDGAMITGRVGVDLTVEEGSRAAIQVGLNILSSMRAELGDLDRIDRVCKLLGMVNAGPGFTQHPVVINGCSQLFFDLLGEDNGVGTRSAFGVSGLPGNAAVEIEGSFILKK